MKEINAVQTPSLNHQLRYDIMPAKNLGWVTSTSIEVGFRKTIQSYQS